MSDLPGIQGAGFAKLAEQMPAAVIIVEAPSGKIIFRNRRIRQIAEQSRGRSRPETLENASNFEIYHPDGSPYEIEEWPLMRAVRDGEEVRGEEFMYTLADGSRIWLRWDSYPIHDEEDRLVAGVLVASDVTEQKRAEEQLSYYALLQESIHDAFIAMDEQFALTAWNKGAEEIYGWRADEVLGRDVREVARTDLSDDQLVQARRELTETGRRRAEVLAYRKDGTPVYVDVTDIALRGVQGQITAYLSIQRDITERKRTEKDLRQSEERFRATFEQAAVGMAHIALDGRWLRVNHRFCDILGYTREELLQKTFQDIIHPDDLENNLSYTRRLLAGDIGIFSMDHRYIRRDGTIVWVNLTESFVREPSGEPSYGNAVIEDITEHKQAEEEIETRGHRQAIVAELGLRALANNDLQSLMDKAVAFAAQTLEAEFCNIAELLPGGEELLMRSGVGWRAGIVGSLAERAGRNSQTGYTLLSAKPVIVEDLSAETRFGRSPLLLEHGVVSGVTVVIPGRGRPFGGMGAYTKSRRTFSRDDVNFLQTIANVLAAALVRHEAEEKVHEVRETERSRMARDLHDEALRDLTYALAETQQVQSISSTDPEIGGRLGLLIAALKRVGQQLRGAIYDLRLEGEQDRPFPELLESLVELHRAMAPACDIRLDVGDGIVSRPLGETGTQLLRIVGEALTNTRRHSDARNVRVAVWASKDTLCAEVSDDGRGLDPAEESSDTSGVGIKGMRERAGVLRGYLKIESEPGQGTKVRFELASKKDREEPEEGVRVLLVEDHATVREAIASAFEREAGFKVVGQVGSLAEARRMLEGVDVAVLDLGLPDGYGGDLIKELREASPQGQALVLSASLDRAEIARAVESGAAGVLQKTAHLDEVVQAVRQLRAGETLMPLEVVVELLRFAGSKREEEYEARQAIARLTAREKEVLQVLAEGLDSQRVAERLGISLRTERNHMASILAKLGVHSQLQALVFALRYGVVEIP